MDTPIFSHCYFQGRIKNLHYIHESGTWLGKELLLDLMSHLAK